MNEFSWIFLIALALMTGIEIWLSLRQRRHVLANRDEVPAAFREQIGLAAHQKAADYTVAKGAQMRRESLFGAVVLILWTLGGGLALLSGAWEELGWSAMTTGVVLILSFLVIGSLLELPLSWYRTFVMEEKFGFNRNTPALFLGDFGKQMLLMLVLGAPIAWVTLWLMNSTGEFWWLYLWAAWMVFAVVMMWLIQPLSPRYLTSLRRWMMPTSNRRSKVYCNVVVLKAKAFM